MVVIMDNTTANKRIEWIDRAKSFCMFLVILGHCHIQESYSFVTQFIYSFHMMLFFFLSGLLCKRDLSYKSLEKDILYIMLPYCIYGIIYIIFETIRSHLYQPENVMAEIISLIIGKDAAIGPIWFLSALFICKQLFYIIKLLKRRSLILYYLFVTLSFIPCFFIAKYQLNLPFFADSALCGLPFFILGNECLFIFSRVDTLRQRYQLLISGFFLVGAIVCSCYNGIVSIADGIIGHSTFLYYLNAIIAIFSIVIICMLIKNYGLFIRITSYGSIATLGLHSYFLIFFNFYFPKLLGIELGTYSIYLAIIYSIVTYLGCYVLIIVLDRYCPKLFGLRGLIHKQIKNI